MRRPVSRLPLLFLLLQLFYPAAVLLARCCGCDVTLRAPVLLLSLQSLLTVACTAVLLRRPPVRYAALLPLAAAVRAVFLLALPLPALLSAAVDLVCGLVLALRFAKRNAGRVLSVGFSTALFLLTALMGAALSLFGFGAVRAIRAVPSPEGTSVAEVVDIDSGALGGETDVLVRKDFTIDLLVGTVIDRLDRIYTGEWREWETMELEWAGENTLRINGTDYPVHP